MTYLHSSSKRLTQHSQRGEKSMNFLRMSSIVLLFVAIFAVASASAASCSDATLKGVYGSILSGFGGDGTPRASVGQATADGKGNLSGTYTKSKDGTIVTGTVTGTYSVAKNCTGSWTTTDQDGETRHVNFVLDNSHKGWQAIQTDSGRVASGFGLAEGAAVCGENGKELTFAANLSGYVIGVGQVAYGEQVILDGKGNVSGNGTFSLAGAIYTVPITGTYTENADCTGSAQITPQGYSTLNFNFVVVNAGKEILLVETDTNTIVSGNMQQ
jgi:hypothetical protein